MTTRPESVFSTFLEADLRCAVFWGLLAVASGVLIWPGWLGAIPAMTDVGGHVANADIWARYDEVELYREMFFLRTGMSPNTLSARFASWLYPLVGIITGIRLFITLMMVATVAALLGTARAFGRSRWTVFLAVPFLWNVGMHWGMVNFIAFFPFFFASLVFARHAGLSGRWTWGLALGATTGVSFFAHGLGPPLSVGAATFVLVCSATDARHLFHLVSMVPAVVVWFWWKAGASGKHGVPGNGIWDMLVHHSYWHPPLKKVEVLVENAFNATSSGVEIYMFAALVGVFLLAIAVSRRAPDAGRRRNGIWDALRWHARAHTLLLTVICLWMAVWIFPSYYSYTNIAMRVFAAFLLAAALLPRLDRNAPLTYVIAIACVSICIGFSAFASHSIRQFQRENLKPIAKLAEHIEPQSRVQCFGLPGAEESEVRFTPLRNNCPGLIQIKTSSFGGTSFALNPFNPVGFRDGYSYTNFKDRGSNDIGFLQKWDYLVTDGPYPRLPEQLTELVATTTGDGPNPPTWHLYRVKSFDRDWSYRATSGGEGGAPFVWHCPRGYALAGYTGQHSHNGVVSHLRPMCRTLPGVDTDGLRREGPQIGHADSHGGRIEKTCPEGMYLVGLNVEGDQMVRGLDTVCAAPTAFDSARDRSSSLTCPAGSIVTGAIGRNGNHVDAIGIGCQSVEHLRNNQHRQ